MCMQKVDSVKKLLASKKEDTYLKETEAMSERYYKTLKL